MLVKSFIRILKLFRDDTKIRVKTYLIDPKTQTRTAFIGRITDVTILPIFDRGSWKLVMFIDDTEARDPEDTGMTIGQVVSKFYNSITERIKPEIFGDTTEVSICVIPAKEYEALFLCHNFDFYTDDLDGMAELVLLI